MKRSELISPLRGAVILRWIWQRRRIIKRVVYDAGYSPSAPCLYLPLFLNDAVPDEHKNGIDMGRDLPGARKPGAARPFRDRGHEKMILPWPSAWGSPRLPLRHPVKGQGRR